MTEVVEAIGGILGILGLALFVWGLAIPHSEFSRALPDAVPGALLLLALVFFFFSFLLLNTEDVEDLEGGASN